MARLLCLSPHTAVSTHHQRSTSPQPIACSFAGCRFNPASCPCPSQLPLPLPLPIRRCPYRLPGCRCPCPIVDFTGFVKPVRFRGSSGFGGGGRSCPQTLHPPLCHLYFYPLFLLPKLHSLNCSYKTRTRDLTYLSYVTWIHDPHSYELEQLASTNIISVLCPSLTLNKISD